MSFARSEAAPTLAVEEARLLKAAAAKVPRRLAAGARIKTSPSKVMLTVPLEVAELPARAWFYPLEYGVIDYGAPQPLRRAQGGIELTLERGELRTLPLERLDGVLVLSTENNQHSIGIDLNSEANRPLH